jgi:predicted nucleic acid-binding protein
MIYLDTSCLLKIIRIEDASVAVGSAIAKEQTVVISPLAELETLIELKGRHMAGDYTLPELRRLELQLHALRQEEPFLFRNVPAGVWEVAFRQHRNSKDVHCRALDRLHLAAAEKLGIARFMTHDVAQARAAEDLGFDVILPR